MCPPLFGIYLRTGATKPAGYEDVSPAYGQTRPRDRGADRQLFFLWKIKGELWLHDSKLVRVSGTVHTGEGEHQRL